MCARKGISLKRAALQKLIYSLLQQWRPYSRYAKVCRDAGIMRKLLLELLIRALEETTLHINPAAEEVIAVKYKVAACFAVAYQQGCKRRGCRIFMRLHKGLQIKVGENIHIMRKKGLPIVQELCSVLYATACFKRLTLFQRDGDICTKVIIVQILNHFICKMMHIYHNLRKSCALKFCYKMPQQRLAAHLYKRLWNSLRYGL